LRAGQTKARRADNGYSISKRRNAGMARAQGFPSGKPPGGHLLRCVLLQGNNPCRKHAPCIWPLGGSLWHDLWVKGRV